MDPDGRNRPYRANPPGPVAPDPARRAAPRRRNAHAHPVCGIAPRGPASVRRRPQRADPLFRRWRHRRRRPGHRRIAASWSAAPSTTGDRSSRPTVGRCVFTRTTGSRDALWVAGVDGSNARELPDTGAVDGSIDWSPSGDRLVVTPHDSGVPKVIDVASGSATELTFAAGISSATWRPGHDQLLVTVGRAGRDEDVLAGGRRRHRPTPDHDCARSSCPDRPCRPTARCSPTPPGGTIGGEDGCTSTRAGCTSSRSTVARTCSSPLPAADGFIWQFPALSPDGSHVVALRFANESTTARGPGRRHLHPLTRRDR